MNQALLLIGHPWELQLCNEVFESGQLAPPLAGGGLLHSLDLVSLPPPQVVLHVDQAVHGPHWPSNEKGYPAFSSIISLSSWSN